MSNTRYGADLGNGSVGKLLMRLALPAIAAQIINVLYNMVDRAYIGHIQGVGTQALTGVGVTMPVIIAISAFAALVAMGSAPRAGIMMGRNDRQEAERIMGGSFFALVAAALALTAAVLLFGRPVLMLFGASENTIGYAMDYLNIYACGTLFVQLTLGMNAFISTQGYAKTSMLSVAIGAVCNIALDPIFIFALDMGVRGAALATILSQAVSCLWVLRFLTGKKSALRLRRENIRFSWRVMGPCLALGVAPFIMQFTEAVISVCFNASLLRYGGDLAVGAMTILGSVMQFSMLPLQGLTQGAQPIISFNFGAGNLKRVTDTFRVLLFACIGYATALWAVCMFAPKVFILIFAADPALVDFTMRAMRVYMAASLLFGIQIACQQTFIAIGNAKVSMFLALLRKVLLLIPLIYLLPAILPDQTIAVFLAEPVADTLAVLTTSILFYRSMRNLKRTMAAAPAQAADGSR